MPRLSNIANPGSQSHNPRHDREEKDRDVVPEGLDVLEFGSEEAFEIVLDDEDVEEGGIALGAEDVPRQGCEAKDSDGDGMKKAKRVAPPLGKERPEEDGTAAENNSSWAFGENGESKKETEEYQCEPWRARENGASLAAHKAEGYGGANHRDR